MSDPVAVTALVVSGVHVTATGVWVLWRRRATSAAYRTKEAREAVGVLRKAVQVVLDEGGASPREFVTAARQAERDLGDLTGAPACDRKLRALLVDALVAWKSVFGAAPPDEVMVAWSSDFERPGEAAKRALREEQRERQVEQARAFEVAALAALRRLDELDKAAAG